MKRPFFFHRLQWKLTRAYVLVTVALAASLQIAVYSLVMFVLIREFRTPDFPPRIAATMLEAAPQFAPHLATHLATQNELLLRQFRFIADYDFELTGGRFQFGFNFAGQADERDFLDQRLRALVLTNPSGQVLAVYGKSPLVKGANISALSPAAAERLRLARSGVIESAQLVNKSSDQIVLAAVPIFDEARQQVIGIFWAEVNVALGWDLASGLIREIFGQLIWVPIFGLVFGLAFGFITARNLTHRLNRLAYAAGEWGQGKFDERAPEKPRDELGSLGERLNHMAAELQKQIALQQQLGVIKSATQ